MEEIVRINFLDPDFVTIIFITAAEPLLKSFLEKWAEKK